MSGTPDGFQWDAFQPDAFQEIAPGEQQQEGTGSGSAGYDLKLENGFFLLQEDGSYILTEDQPLGIPDTGSAGYDLQLENGFFLLQEDGSYILLENQPAITVTGYVKPPGGDDAPGHPGVPPTLVKDKPRKRSIVERDELEELYNRRLRQPSRPSRRCARR
jgi:hypothetical protein